MTKCFTVFLISVLLFGGRSPAAVVDLVDFSSDPGGAVTDRDGFLSVNYDGGNEYVTGSFAFDPFNTPQTDAFAITLPSFTGSYAGITQFSFQMYGVNALPSDLFLRFVDGFMTSMSYQISPVGGMLNNWATFTVNLTYSAAWGVNQATFDSILSSVNLVEIELTRNGGSAQEYRLDNLQTLATDLGEGSSAVPEPSTITMMALFLAALATRRNLFRLPSRRIPS